ncbi:zinc ribbon domain-containing protein [Lutibacter sp.]|uniref:zinc ribbon domain-containing protein n=1 Tax=Lutibacter sp. TaxID=1925666 RepID=UPI001A1E084E|nr:zinc ribbon domain-containing protein [Lutibacter sp.]MBI9041733.1 zinc ribbon domain-containing protein [Lutibacter sp.]
MKEYKTCQSCAMPLKKDPKGVGGGKNADGKTSHKYCSYCYEDGKFLQPDITAEEMQAFVKEKLKEMGGFMKLFAGVFSKGIPKLERWKKD